MVTQRKFERVWEILDGVWEMYKNGGKKWKIVGGEICHNYIEVVQAKLLPETSTVEKQTPLHL
jgi:hypothetical protein